MAVQISQTADNKIWVNDKLVFKDSDNNWITHRELTQLERRDFNSYLRSIGEI